MARYQLEDAVIADGDPKEGRSKVAQGGLATVDRLAVHDPVLVPGWLIAESPQASLGEFLADLGSEEHGEGCDMHQEGAA